MWAGINTAARHGRQLAEARLSTVKHSVIDHSTLIALFTLQERRFTCSLGP
jgi:hypothetical protein